MKNILNNIIEGNYRIAYNQFMKKVTTNIFLQIGIIAFVGLMIYKFGKNFGQFIYYVFN